MATEPLWTPHGGLAWLARGRRVRVRPSPECPLWPEDDSNTALNENRHLPAMVGECGVIMTVDYAKRYRDHFYEVQLDHMGADGLDRGWFAAAELEPAL